MRRLLVLSVHGLLLVAALPSGALRGQSPDGAPIARRMSRLQADFERHRRHALPAVPGLSTGCDERIGRFCYWHDDAEAEPPPEPPRIAAARERLVATLDSARRTRPEDDWIVGQLVRYLVESGRAPEALDVANSCAATPWWCAALAGYALHAAERFAGADSAFAAALRQMPDVERCRWTDLAPLLGGALRRRYEALPCVARDTLQAQLWWLGQPLYMLDGHDLRSEHFARQTVSRIAERSQNAYGTRWGDDMRELTLRYGWPIGWSREPPRPSDPATVHVRGHDRSPGFYFFPLDSALVAPASAGTDAWQPNAPRPRARYAPGYARRFTAAPHQLARFARGDSSLVAVAFDVRDDTSLASTTLDAALVLTAGPERERTIVRRAPARPNDVLVATTTERGFVVSLELLARQARRVARARYGVRRVDVVPGRLALSDLLLFDARDGAPTELDGVLPHALGAGRARTDRPLGVYWEPYGAAADRPLTVTLTVTRARPSFARRVARAIGLGDGERSVALRWSDAPTSASGRSVAIALSRLTPGHYLVRVAIATDAGDGVSATRAIEIVAP